MEIKNYPEHLVFGLDIGTRSLVGTVGYRENEHKFTVVAQCVKLHETRAMLDGQIHDIPKVAESIQKVKWELENQIDRKLTDVCIAAAGRVLKTVTVEADYEFSEETLVNVEHIHSLELLAVEKAYEDIRKEQNSKKINFYCVGYSVVHYYLNDYQMSNLEGHKANKIATELLATFLPEEVIDGLYSAVERADLQVANMTLEPIAAINIAIPEKFRLLNIALIDVGAGTSDISITKDGSVTAYGMIPFAGDELTEIIVQKYLVDFNTAEEMKIACDKQENITYSDIMGLSYTIPSIELITQISDAVKKIALDIANKIIELNGDKSVSAAFVVGGGGKIPGFVEALAQYLKIQPERVALRGKEVLQEVNFLQEGIEKDPLLVTPIGICLNYYEQKNNFIFVNINNERVKLYDNNKLTVVDAAIQVGYPNEKLFPRRGKTINYIVNETKKMFRGELGEAAEIKVNGKIASINTKILANDIIEIKESTIGSDAVYTVAQIPEYKSTINFLFNNREINCPKFIMANNELVSEFYNIEDGDELKILNYYTLEQVLEFMDLHYNGPIEVNHIVASMQEKVYENFSIDCDIPEEHYESTKVNKERSTDINNITAENKKAVNKSSTDIKKAIDKTQEFKEVRIIVNGQNVVLKNKEKYILVDILDFYNFDLTVARGNKLIIKINGKVSVFTDIVGENDIIEMYWEE